MLCYFSIQKLQFSNFIRKQNVNANEEKIVNKESPIDDRLRHNIVKVWKSRADFLIIEFRVKF